MSNNKHVLKLQSPFEKIKKSNTHGEIALFRAVITQMIIDSTNISDKIESKKLAQNAREWLFKKMAF
jgi:hypothetical protein